MPQQFEEVEELVEYLAKERDCQAYGLPEGFDNFYYDLVATEGSCTPDEIEYHPFTWWTDNRKLITFSIAIVNTLDLTRSYVLLKD